MMSGLFLDLPRSPSPRHEICSRLVTSPRTTKVATPPTPPAPRPLSPPPPPLLPAPHRRTNTPSPSSPTLNSPPPTSHATQATLQTPYANPPYPYLPFPSPAWSSTLFPAGCTLFCSVRYCCGTSPRFLVLACAAFPNDDKCRIGKPPFHTPLCPGGCYTWMTSRLCCFYGVFSVSPLVL